MSYEPNKRIKIFELKAEDQSQSSGLTSTRLITQEGEQCLGNLWQQDRAEVLQQILSQFPEVIFALISNYDYYFQGRIDGYICDENFFCSSPDGRVVTTWGIYDKKGLTATKWQFPFLETSSYLSSRSVFLIKVIERRENILLLVCSRIYARNSNHLLSLMLYDCKTHICSEEALISKFKKIDVLPEEAKKEVNDENNKIQVICAGAHITYVCFDCVSGEADVDELKDFSDKLRLDCTLTVLSLQKQIVITYSGILLVYQYSARGRGEGGEKKAVSEIYCLEYGQSINLECTLSFSDGSVLLAGGFYPDVLGVFMLLKDCQIVKKKLFNQKSQDFTEIVRIPHTTKAVIILHDKTISVWDIEKWELGFVICDMLSEKNFALLPNNDIAVFFACQCDGKHIYIYDIETGETKQIVQFWMHNPFKCIQQREKIENSRLIVLDDGRLLCCCNSLGVIIYR